MINSHEVYKARYDARMRNMTTRELISYCDATNNHCQANREKLIAELANRLDLCLDFATKQAGL